MTTRPTSMMQPAPQPGCLIPPWPVVLILRRPLCAGTAFFNLSLGRRLSVPPPRFLSSRLQCRRRHPRPSKKPGTARHWFPHHHPFLKRGVGCSVCYLHCNVAGRGPHAVVDEHARRARLAASNPDLDRITMSPSSLPQSPASSCRPAHSTQKRIHKPSPFGCPCCCPRRHDVSFPWLHPPAHRLDSPSG